MLEVQDIFCQYGAEYLEHHSLSPTQAKAFRAIQNCRTAVLGAHLDTCDHCGFTKISYNSCRNRHCPKCQAFSKEQWIEKQNSYLLNTDYFHVVFTVPNDLNSILLRNQQTTYTLFFKAVSKPFWNYVLTGNILVLPLALPLFSIPGDKTSPTILISIALSPAAD